MSLNFSNSIFSPPYDSQLFYKHAAFFVLIQVIIWIKAAVFYYLYGYGLMYANPILIFIRPEIFASARVLAEWTFQQAMHVLIFIALLLFTRRIKNVNILQLIVFFAIAVFLHNVGYWFTNSFLDINEIIADAVFNYLALFFFFFAIRTAMQNKFLARIMNIGRIWEENFR